MNKTVKYSLLTLVFIGVIALAVVGYNYLSEHYEITENTDEIQPQTEATLQIAPDFEVLNVQGETVKLKDHFGKPIVINFWATWCGPCKSEMPAFENLYGEYKDEVNFMMVNLTDGYQDTITKVNKFVQENGYSFPIYYDTKYSAAYTYGVNSVPMSIFINNKGEIVDYHIGAMSEKNLKNYIEKIL